MLLMCLKLSTLNIVNTFYPQKIYNYFDRDRIFFEENDFKTFEEWKTMSKIQDSL